MTGKWETIVSPSGEMIHVRWSVPNAKGEYLYCAHYPNQTPHKYFAEDTAERWNAEGKAPVLRHAGGYVYWPLGSEVTTC